MNIPKEQWIEIIKEKFPSGIILGDVKGIVGLFGLTLEFVNPKNYERETIRYKENEEISFSEVNENSLLISGLTPKTWVSIHYFKKIILRYSKYI